MSSSVIITGICGTLGRRLARELHRRGPVIGLDRRPFPGKPRDVEHHELDQRSKRVEDLFRTRDVGALVHLGVMHNLQRSGEEHYTFNIRGFQRLLDYVQAHSVKKLVFVSSANVYGPRPDNPQFLTEDAPLLASSRFTEMRDLVQVDMLAQSFFWKCPQTETVILRPTHILGTVKNAPSNYLRLRRVPVLAGYDPMIQVLHEDDLVRAVVSALAPGARGIYNVAGPPPVALSRALSMLNRRRVVVPHGLFRFGLGRLFTWHLTSFPAPELDFIRYVCMVDDERARTDLKYEPRHDLIDSLNAVDAERWV